MHEYRLFINVHVNSQLFFYQFHILFRMYSQVVKKFHIWLGWCYVVCFSSNILPGLLLTC